MNSDSLIFPYQTFDSDTIFMSVRGPWSASVFLWIISAIWPSLNLLHHTDTSFRWKRFGHKHSLTCDESRYDSLLLFAKIWPLRGTSDSE
jgi:hypothetical protein